MLMRLCVWVLFSVNVLGCTVGEVRLEALEVLPDSIKDAQELPFETIERSDWNGTKKRVEAEPHLFLITDTKAIEKAKGYVSQEASKNLDHLNFDTHFAILVFHGQLDYLDEGVFQVTKIYSQKELLALIATAPLPPSSDRMVKDSISSPYHLVKVSHHLVKGTDLIVDLYFNQQRVLSLIPDN